jgi:hypothetical protein
VTLALYSALILYEVSNFSVYGLCICAWLMSVCVPQCMDYVLDNLWCSNSKNLCVPMFLPILYYVFHLFFIYASNCTCTKYLQCDQTTDNNMYDFYWFPPFLAQEAPKPTSSDLVKTGLVNRQNQSVYRYFIRFIDWIQIFWCFEFCTGFWPVLPVFDETGKTGPIWFLDLCRFFNPRLSQGNAKSDQLHRLHISVNS